MAKNEARTAGEEMVAKAPETRRRRRFVVVAVVLGAAFLAFGVAAFATPAGDLLLADLLANSLKSLGQGAEMLKSAEEQARRVREAADLAQRVSNTADAMRDLNAKRIAGRFGSDVMGAYPEMGQLYSTVGGLGSEKGLVDWSITYCLSDGLEKVTDPATGKEMSRGEWCKRYKESRDGRSAYAAYVMLAGAPAAVQAAALESQRRQLILEEDLFQFRLCLHMNEANCTRAVCAGPEAWAKAPGPQRQACRRVQIPGQPPPSPAVGYGSEPRTGGQPACPNPFQDLHVTGNNREKGAAYKAVCEDFTQQVTLAEMAIRAEGGLSESRKRQIDQLGEMIAAAKAKDDAGKALSYQANATIKGAAVLEKQLQMGTGGIAPVERVNGDKALHLERPANP